MIKYLFESLGGVNSTPINSKDFGKPSFVGNHPEEKHWVLRALKDITDDGYVSKVSKPLFTIGAKGKSVIKFIFSGHQKMVIYYDKSGGTWYRLATVNNNPTFGEERRKYSSYGEFFKDFHYNIEYVYKNKVGNFINTPSGTIFPEGESYAEYSINYLRKVEHITDVKRKDNKFTFNFYGQGIEFEYDNTFDTYKLISLTTKKNVDGGGDAKSKQQYLDNLINDLKKVYGSNIKLTGRLFKDAFMGK